MHDGVDRVSAYQFYVTILINLKTKYFFIVRMMDLQLKLPHDFLCEHDEYVFMENFFHYHLGVPTCKNALHDLQLHNFQKASKDASFHALFYSYLLLD